MRSVRRRRDHLLGVIVGGRWPSSRQRSRPRQPCAPATGPRERRPSPGSSRRLELVSYAAAVAAPSSSPRRNSVPSTQMRCSTTPSLRAGATRARLGPRRLATSTARRLSDEKPSHARQQHVRVRRVAGPWSAVRTPASPALVIEPTRSASPDRWRFGVRPKQAPSAFDLAKRPGSSTPVLWVGDKGRAHPRHGHQPPAQLVPARGPRARSRACACGARRARAASRVAGAQHRLHGGLEHRVPADQDEHPLLEPAPRRGAHPQPEAASGPRASSARGRSASAEAACARPAARAPPASSPTCGGPGGPTPCAGAARCRAHGTDRSSPPSPRAPPRPRIKPGAGSAASRAAPPRGPPPSARREATPTAVRPRARRTRSARRARP